MPRHSIKTCGLGLLLSPLSLVCYSENIAATTWSKLPGEHEIGLRSRYQSTNDDWKQDATAFTTRFTLTSKFDLDDEQQWQLLLQPNLVMVHEDKFNSIVDYNQYSRIPDPKGNSLTQGYVKYDNNNNWQFSLGRQILSHDNERHLGGSEFWQTPQSFDAFTLDYNDQLNWRVLYSYSNKVHRIFGPDSERNLPKSDPRYYYLKERPVSEWGEHKLDAHLLNVSYKTENNLRFSSYLYLTDNQDLDAVSNQTLGIRLTDEFKPERIKYRYTAEFAWQQDAYDNPTKYEAWYNLIEGSIQYRSHIFQLGQETMSHDDGNGFKTPYGSNHKFQGWADIFASYSGQKGLRDTYVGYRGRHKKLRWRAVWHDFRSYGSGLELGQELDIELAYRYTRKWEFKLVYSTFDSANTKQAEYKAANFDFSTWFISAAYNI